MRISLEAYFPAPHFGSFSSRGWSLLLVIVAMVGAAQAGSVPGRWEKMSILDPGARIAISEDSGSKIEGEFVSLEDRELLLRMDDGSLRRIERALIKEIVHLTGRPDDPWDGAVLGALTGTGVFLVGHAVTFPEEPLPVHSGDALLMPLSAVIGLATGYFLDRRHGQVEEILYQAR